MADWNGMVSKASCFGGGGGSSEEFEEADVWNVGNERQYNSKQQEFHSSGSSSSSVWRLSTAPRTIPRFNNNNNNPSTHEAIVVHKSAPLGIPDWSKIYGKSATGVATKTNASWVNNNDNDEDQDDGNVNFHGDGDDDEDENEDDEDENEDDDDDDDGLVPPHEWLARKLARSQISSFSVCEGIGRTLKGRDLSKVRNAILSKTGFLE